MQAASARPAFVDMMRSWSTTWPAGEAEPWRIAVAALLVNDAAMMDRCVTKIMQAVAAAPNGVSGHGDQFQRSHDVMLNIALTADICYARMSAAQLVAVAKFVNGTCDNWRREDATFWPYGEPLNNYWQNGVLAMAIAGICTQGFNDRAAEWRTLADTMLTAFAARIADYSTGIQSEGMYYGSYLGNALLAMRWMDQVLGGNRVSAYPVKAQLEMMMAAVRPHRDHHFLVGSEAAVANAQWHSVKFTSWRIHILCEGDTPTAREAKALMDSSGWADGNSPAYWRRAEAIPGVVIWSTDHIGAASIDAKQTGLLVAAAAGVIGKRSNWSKTGVAVLMFANKTGPFGPANSHSNPDAPGFQWASGPDWLVCDPEAFGQSGIDNEEGFADRCKASNIVYMGDPTNPATRPLVSSVETSVYTRVSIDASGYYGATYRREYVWLDGMQVGVIFDRINRVGDKRWQIHVPPGSTKVRVRSLIGAQPTASSVFNCTRLSALESGTDYRSLKVLDINGRASAAALGDANEAVVTIGGVMRRVKFFDDGSAPTVT